MDASDTAVDAMAASSAAPLTATGAPTASDLFNRQVDLQKIDFLTGRVLHLQAENDMLRERHDKREQETHEFVAYFQKEIQTRDKQITKLTEEVAALKLNHALEVETLQQTKDSESLQLQQHFSSKEEKFSEQLYFLKEELQQLEAFRDMKDTIHAKLHEVEKQLHDEQETAKEQLGAVERKFLEEKARLQKEHEKKIELVKQQAKEDARNGLDADTRKIVTDNRRMGDELRFQLQMTDELQREKEHFEATAKKHARELQIATAKEEEFGAAAQKQARDVRQLRATIKDLEKRMSEGLAALEREKYVAETKNGKELEEMTLDVDGLRRLVRLKNKELRNLRRLAQTVLDQRTDVEVFFLDALEVVKREMENEAKRQRERAMEQYHMDMKNATARHASPLLRFPKLTSPNDPTSSTSSDGRSGSVHFGDKIDLRQLSWQDKERVLRLVFAKINGVQSYADATPQSPPVLSESGTVATGPVTARRRSVNQEAPTPQPQPQPPAASAVYFATEPTGRSVLGRGASSTTLSMSLSGLPIGPSPPPSSTKRR